MVDLKKALVDFSNSLPEWQRDALRRIVTQPKIEKNDIKQLVALAKKHGGADKSTPESPTPLTSLHLSSALSAQDRVILESMHSVQNVNALAPNQTVLRKYSSGPRGEVTEALNQVETATPMRVPRSELTIWRAI